MAAESVQARLPAEMTTIINEIREARGKNLEPTSTKSIMIDALKEMHSRLKESQHGTQA